MNWERKDRVEAVPTEVDGEVDGRDAETVGGDKPSAEIGGRPGPDPVRFGDWEKNGRCIDF